jgi:hypothetical protein
MLFNNYFNLFESSLCWNRFANLLLLSDLKFIILFRKFLLISDLKTTMIKDSFSFKINNFILIDIKLYLFLIKIKNH